jgi:hypothetical protein
LGFLEILPRCRLAEAGFIEFRHGRVRMGAVWDFSTQRRGEDDCPDGSVGYVGGMKYVCALAVTLLAGCAADTGGFTKWTVGSFRSSVPHAPALGGYTQVKSEGVEFRKYRVHFPEGVWEVALDAGDPPISIRTQSGKRVSLAAEWYPEEGGADSASVCGFTKGAERLLILQGTSDVTYEETRVKFVGDAMSDVRRYATKGEGMGPEMPGVEPEHLVYPPE